MNFTEKTNITYKTFIEDISNISSIEDPITGCELPLAKYLNIYKLVLEEFNGEDEMSYMDFFFEPHPLRSYYLIFKNNVAKEYFLDWAIEKNISDKLHEIHKSETDEEERKRKNSLNIKAIDIDSELKRIPDVPLNKIV